MSNIFVISNTSGTDNITLTPGQLDGPLGAKSSTDLQLFGMGSFRWGEGYNQNFLRILENFAAPQKESGDYNPSSGNNDYDPSAEGILPKDSNDLGPGKGVTNPVTGQLWVNTDTGTIYMFDSTIDSTFGWKQVNGSMPSGNSSPPSPRDGDLWFDGNYVNVWDGSQWVILATKEELQQLENDVYANFILRDGSNSMTGSLDLGSNQLINVQDPSGGQDAATKSYVDTEINTVKDDTANTLQNYVKTDGSNSMTGSLDLGSNQLINVQDPSGGQDAATKSYVDSKVSTETGDLSGSVDDTYVNLSGDTMTGVLTLDNTSGSELKINYSSSALRIGEGNDINSGSDIRKDDSMMIYAGGSIYQHFSSGGAFKVARGGDSRGSSFTDLITIDDQGVVNARSNYETFNISNSSLINKKYVDDAIDNRTVSDNGGEFTGDVGIRKSPSVALDVDGEIQATGDVTAFASDERLKENINTLQNCLSRVQSIEAVEFNWNDLAYQKGLNPTFHHQTGVLAQQIEQVLPDAVRPAPFDEQYLTVQYEKLTTLLIGAIKELASTVEQQETRLQQLEQKNDT